MSCPAAGGHLRRSAAVAGWFHRPRLVSTVKLTTPGASHVDATASIGVCLIEQQHLLKGDVANSRLRTSAAAAKTIAVGGRRKNGNVMHLMIAEQDSTEELRLPCQTWRSRFLSQPRAQAAQMHGDGAGLNALFLPIIVVNRRAWEFAPAAHPGAQQGYSTNGQAAPARYAAQSKQAAQTMLAEAAPHAGGAATDMSKASARLFDGVGKARAQRREAGSDLHRSLHRRGELHRVALSTSSASHRLLAGQFKSPK